MSTDSPVRGHRHTRSFAIPTSPAASSHPRNPHHLNQHAHVQNSRPEMNTYNSDGPSTPPPRTPQKDRHTSSQGPSSSTLSGTGSKQKSRKQHRPKNVMTSPLATRHASFTGAKSAGIPSAKPLNTPTAPAYAGPTFHASPAPSALPIPSYYSKSVPDSPGVKGLNNLKNDPLSSTPPCLDASANEAQREESPLDFMFRADREEKARAQSAKSQLAGKSGPFQPPSSSPRASVTPPVSTHIQPQHGSASRMPGSGIFVMELDGEKDPDSPYGPAFSTPYADRISAARNSQPRPSHQPVIGSATANSEAIKAYLFSNSPTVPATRSESDPNLSLPLASHDYNPTSNVTSGPRSAGLPPRPHYTNFQYNPDTRQQYHNARTSGRSSGLRQEVTPSSTPTRPQGLRDFGGNTLTPTHVSPSIARQTALNVHVPASSTPEGPSEKETQKVYIADSLKKMLNLKPVANADIANNALGSEPSAAATVPNDIGGQTTYERRA